MPVAKITVRRSNVNAVNLWQGLGRISLVLKDEQGVSPGLDGKGFAARRYAGRSAKLKEEP